jgi:hypothetical protein
MKSKIFFSVSFFLLFFIGCSTVEELTLNDKFNRTTEEYQIQFELIKKELSIPKSAKIESAEIDSVNREIKLNLSREFAVIPLREDNVERIYTNVKNYFNNEFPDYKVEIYCLGYPIEQLVPNIYRTEKIKKDSSRLPKISDERIPIVQDVSKKVKPVKGLFGRNILLWHSHGWYYNNFDKRWMWQRARLFQTVEDIGPLAFTIPYLIPMLENAGANVFVPRERDFQLNEIIIDNDFSSKENYVENSLSENNQWTTSARKGFALLNKTIKEGENPFRNGTSRFVKSMINPLATIKWLPEFPESGNYAVYISYQSSDANVTDARYKVLHAGGETEFLVNQTIGGGTWIYLGNFTFDKGKNNQGVVLTNQSKEAGKIVSGDAVRFGGGMGIVEREGTTSKRPKFTEGARYWMQFAGMPDSITYNLNNNSDDYKDDYQSRAEYGNYLFGAPFSPNKNRNVKGLGITMDLSLAFHTDAGITRNDTAIGTLMIYTITGLDTQNVFPDGVSRLANRDLSDIVQTQIVEDIRTGYDSAWTRRQLMNANYSESARPNFPSMLLELLSHQNFYEMKFALDPRFRFDVSRSIYKGMLKFLSVQYGFEYVVQPLPPTHFSAVLNSNGEAELSWKPQIDESEPSASADKYILYTRIDNGGFDNGRLVETNKIKLNDLKVGSIYSYKVTAINEGGESFPSEILSVCRVQNSPEPILIVNGFDRVSAPASFESDKFLGFTNFIDEGVPDKFDLGFTGTQFNFDPDSKWETDDNPGHGASHSDYESKVIAGNTFDFVYLHGKAIKENGFSFCSASDESVMNGDVEIKNYKMVGIILGEEKKTPAPKYKDKIEFEVFPDLLKQKITDYLTSGGKLFLSGSYIGTDLYSDKDSTQIKFANDVLKFKLKTGHAVKTGGVFSVNSGFFNRTSDFSFNTEFSDKIYKVEAPDEIGAVKGSEVLLSYAENEFSAAVGYKGNYGVVSFGFPFETIIGEQQRTLIMKSVLNYLEVK